MKSSVSRPAVPLPMAMTSMRYCSTRSATVVMAWTFFATGGCGKMTVWYSRFPCSSRQTTLQPVRKPHRSRQEQLPQILAEDADRVHIGLLLGFPQDFTRDGRLEETLVGVVHGRADLQPAFPGRIALFLAIVVVHLVAALLGVRVDGQFQEALVFRPENGQKAVRGNLGDGIGEIEIGAVLVRGGICLGGLGRLGTDPARAVDAAEVLPDDGRLGKPLRDDVAGAGEGVIDGSHLPFHELLRVRLRIAGLPAPDQVRQRLQSLGHRHGGTGLPLGTEGQVQVLQGTGTYAVIDLSLQLRRQFSLFLDSTEDGSLPLLHLPEHLGPMLDFRYFHVRKSAGPFFPVSADERDGASLREEFRAILHLPVLHLQQRRNVPDI